MKKTVSALEARRRLGEIMEGVYYRGDEVIVERAGKPMCAIVPVERYRDIDRSRDRMFELIERSWERNKDVPFEEIEREVWEAIREVRKEQYGLRGDEED